MIYYPTDREPEWSPEDYELAWEKTCEDTELVGEWISGAHTADFDERQDSSYWGPISSDSLLQLLLKGDANAEQKVAIVDELQARWERDTRSLVEAKAKKIAQDRIEADEAELSRAQRINARAALIRATSGAWL